MHNPILVGGATAAGFIPNKPTHKMLRHCIEVLQANGRLLFFPEGTRTRRKEHGCINPFLGGLAIIAKNSHAPVWPIFVQTDSPYLCKGWSLWRLPPKKIHIRMTVGEPVTFAADDDTDTFLNNLRQRYLTALETAA
jgi:1-acyl-sn-glycerol-3-phosphate acyltransferase